MIFNNSNINNVFTNTIKKYKNIANSIGYKLNYLFTIWLFYPVINYILSQFNLGFRFTLQINFFNFPLDVNICFGKIKDFVNKEIDE